MFELIKRTKYGMHLRVMMMKICGCCCCVHFSWMNVMLNMNSSYRTLAWFSFHELMEYIVSLSLRKKSKQTKTSSFVHVDLVLSLSLFPAQWLHVICALMYAISYVGRCVNYPQNGVCKQYHSLVRSLAMCNNNFFFLLRPLFRFKTASVLIAHQMTHTFILDEILNYTQLKITIIHKWTTRYLSPIHVSCVMWYLIWLCKKQKKINDDMQLVYSVYTPAPMRTHISKHRSGMMS